MTRKFGNSSLAAGVLLAVAGPGLAACDDAPEQKEQEITYQCAIEHDGVEEAVDCDDVNDSGSAATAYVGGFYYPVFIHSYPYAGAAPAAPGSSLPAGGYRIGYRDSAGRAQAGLPSSGKVANGTVKSGTIGKGGVPVAGTGGKAGS